MTIHSGILRLQVLDDEMAVGKAAAAMIALQVRRKPTSVLLLPTGRTPLTMYNHLSALVRIGRLNLQYVRTFILDEFYGLLPSHPNSYRSYMQRVLFDHVSVPLENIYILNSVATVPQIECARYETAIAECGGVDLAVLGIGANGSIGFNEPGSHFTNRTRLVTFQKETRTANSFLFQSDTEAVPTTAMTVGLATILAARRVLLLATDITKAEALEAALYGPVTPDVPASVLRWHPDVTVLADCTAASAPAIYTRFP